MSSTDNFACVLTLATVAATAAVAAVAAKENKDRTAIAATEKPAATASATASDIAAAAAANTAAATAAAAYAAADTAAAAAATAANVDGDKVRGFITGSLESLERSENKPYKLSPETRKDRIALFTVLSFRLTEKFRDQERKINDLKQQVGVLTGQVLPMENNDKQNRAERFSHEPPSTEQLAFLCYIVNELRQKVYDQNHEIDTLTKQLKATQLPAKSAK